MLPEPDSAGVPYVGAFRAGHVAVPSLVHSTGRFEILNCIMVAIAVPSADCRIERRAPGSNRRVSRCNANPGESITRKIGALLPTLPAAYARSFGICSTLRNYDGFLIN